MTKKLTITAEQQKTDDLFGAFLEKDWSSNGQKIANIFNAFYTAAYSREHLEKISEALYGCQSDLSEALGKLVRAKVLRSYQKQGRRLYEVNY